MFISIYVNICMFTCIVENQEMTPAALHILIYIEIEIMQDNISYDNRDLKLNRYGRYDDDSLKSIRSLNQITVYKFHPNKEIRFFD